MISGLLLELYEPIPRIRMSGSEPGCPFVESTCTPDVAPDKAFVTLVTGRISSFSFLMELAEPVKVHDVVFYVYQFRAPVSFLFRAFENFNLAPYPLYDITHPAVSSHI